MREFFRENLYVFYAIAICGLAALTWFANPGLRSSVKVFFGTFFLRRAIKTRVINAFWQSGSIAISEDFGDEWWLLRFKYERDFVSAYAVVKVYPDGLCQVHLAAQNGGYGFNSRVDSFQAIDDMCDRIAKFLVRGAIPEIGGIHE